MIHWFPERHTMVLNRSDLKRLLGDHFDAFDRALDAELSRSGVDDLAARRPAVFTVYGFASGGADDLAELGQRLPDVLDKMD